MKFIAQIILILFMLPTFALASSDVKKMTSIVPIFSQKVEHNIPKDWKPAFENAQQGHYILEFLPKDETLKDWTEMFTVQGFKGLASKVPPKSFLQQTADMHRKACGDKAVFEYLGEETISGFEAQKAIIGCASIPKDPSGNTKMSEIAYFLAIKGTEDIYLLHKAQRGEVFDVKTPSLTKENSADFMAEFMPFKLCEKTTKPKTCP